MSDVLYLIPDVPAYVPDHKAADEAARLLESILPGTGKIEVKVTDTPVLVEPGNAEYIVACPRCGQNAKRWFGEALARYQAEGESAFSIVPPCCGSRATLDELSYKPAAGFARFVISAHNPERELTRKEREQLSKSAGCNLREVSTAAVAAAH